MREKMYSIRILLNNKPSKDLLKHIKVYEKKIGTYFISNTNPLKMKLEGKKHTQGFDNNIFVHFFENGCRIKQRRGGEIILDKISMWKIEDLLRKERENEEICEELSK